MDPDRSELGKQYGYDKNDPTVFTANEQDYKLTYFAQECVKYVILRNISLNFCAFVLTGLK